MDDPVEQIVEQGARQYATLFLGADCRYGWPEHFSEETKESCRRFARRLMKEVVRGMVDAYKAKQAAE